MRFTITDYDPSRDPRRRKPVHVPPPVCETCNGTGWVALPPVKVCQHGRACAECYEYDEDICRTCEGTGRRPCDECGEFDATTWVDGDGLCSICAGDRRRKRA